MSEQRRSPRVAENNVITENEILKQDWQNVRKTN